MVDRERRKNLGRILHDVRTERNLSVQQVADRLYVSTVQVYRIESGQRSVDLAELPDLARAYDLPAEELATRLDVLATAVRLAK